MIGALKGPFYDQSYVDGLQEKELIATHIDEFLTALPLS
jgi:hypothetical protein